MPIRIRFGVAVFGLGLLAFIPAFAEVATQHIQRQTREDLRAALADEAFTVSEYTAFAEHARSQGKTKLAELFEEKVNDEKKHFKDLSELYGLVREDWDNVAKAIVDEYALKVKTYAQMAERAEALGDKEVAKTFRVIAVSEGQHQADFKDSISKALKPDSH
jgi:rubrerythrin